MGIFNSKSMFQEGNYRCVVMDIFIPVWPKTKLCDKAMMLKLVGLNPRLVYPQVSHILKPKTISNLDTIFDYLYVWPRYQT